MITIPTPPIFTGGAEHQLMQTERYIRDLTDYLSVALNNIPLDSLDKQTQALILGGDKP